MHRDAWSDREHMIISSEARRRAEVALAIALDESPRITHPATRTALHAFVDVLAAEGLTPEAVVIAFKDLLLRAHPFYRFEPEARTALRTALVSECIEHYFGTHATDDAPPARPKLTIIRGSDWERRATSDALSPGESSPDARP
jgi:hypothetical protein